MSSGSYLQKLHISGPGLAVSPLAEVRVQCVSVEPLRAGTGPDCRKTWSGYRGERRSPWLVELFGPLTWS